MSTTVVTMPGKSAAAALPPPVPSVTAADVKALRGIAAGEWHSDTAGSLVGIAALRALMQHGMLDQARRQTDQLDAVVKSGVACQATVGFAPDAVTAIATSAASLLGVAIKPMLEMAELLRNDHCAVDKLRQELASTRATLESLYNHVHRLAERTETFGRELCRLREEGTCLADLERHPLCERIVILEERVLACEARPDLPPAGGRPVGRKPVP